MRKGAEQGVEFGLMLPRRVAVDLVIKLLKFQLDHPKSKVGVLFVKDKKKQGVVKRTIVRPIKK